ncbi:TetR/AcrR family transcriptional regulator [Prolixibacter denitrificans]|uniref:AcrR family transcriptional regulator n=1 Tax=Prolixibacter denitrificans TaxID=1541063 RepID=A0A2P8CJI4_9BACT|nr:TetR/AcrR family transcriptional regulator [Prolixibacter denitrificans]PSK85130.1 AcrR family transcriptional regulator [Prolixibacter denitrificans]GET19755.1 TetR family transcriptional regulator [Prolixibacter denitrificans]
MTSESTEKKILNAARDVFIRKGMDGARMQEIADEAGINKSLLHYYFRSKQKLFEAIFRDAFGLLIPELMKIFKEEGPLLNKIDRVVDRYITVIGDNPFLPQFLIGEINREPDKFVKILQSSGIDPEFLQRKIDEEVEAGNINPIRAADLIPNMIGMVIMPFAGRPLFQTIFFKSNNEEYDAYLDERRRTISAFIKQALVKK